LGWGELDESDFMLITHYANSSFCKPNLDYYREILSKIDKTPAECFMVGNNPAEDIIAEELGIETFLVTDFMENEHDVDISMFRKGTIEDMETYLLSMPDLAVHSDFQNEEK
jgi:FMN phosphatase YigB (HAD superfamily)